VWLCQRPVFMEVSDAYEGAHQLPTHNPNYNPLQLEILMRITAISLFNSWDGTEAVCISSKDWSLGLLAPQDVFSKEGCKAFVAPPMRPWAVARGNTVIEKGALFSIKHPVEMIIKAYRWLVFDGIRIFGDDDSAPLPSHGNPHNRRLPASSSRLLPDAETRSSAQPCPEGWFQSEPGSVARTARAEKERCSFSLPQDWRQRTTPSWPSGDRKQLA